MSTTETTRTIDCVTSDGQRLQLEFAGVYDIPGETIAYEDDPRSMRPDARPLFAISDPAPPVAGIGEPA